MKKVINCVRVFASDEGMSWKNIASRFSFVYEGHLAPIYKAIECDRIDIQERLLHKPNSKKYYDFIIDDEGRFKSGNVETAITYDDNKKVIENFVGSFLVTRHTPNGDIKGLTEEEIEDVLASFGGGLMHLQS